MTVPSVPRPLRVVVAPDSFKGSLDAADVAAHLRDGVLDVLPDAHVTLAPMADGGEGTLAALLGTGTFQPRETVVPDALGRPHPTAWGVSLDHRTAVVELARAAGLPGVADLPARPLDAHVEGVGALARAALDAGVDEIVVGLGGSASTDGGAGVLTALGARLLDADGHPVPPGGRGLARVTSVDLTGLHPRARTVRWRLAVDVTHPLVGPRGAAVVFGPQKGATSSDVAVLDAGLRRWADVLAATTGVSVADLPGAGAAGGVPAALVGVLGATLVPGARLVAETLGLPAALADADLVLTGEGSFDDQSLHGKVVGTVAELAAEARRDRTVPVVVVAGRVAVPPAQALAAGVTAAWSLADGPATLDDVLARTPSLLRRAAANATSLVAAARG